MGNSYEDRVAYRHPNGEVEGFKGVGGTKKKARDDAIDQIQRKLAIVRQDFRPDDPPYDPARLITSHLKLSVVELKVVLKDWSTNVRY
jgi:hypothetical protein